jgi:polar amino acid transport system substrate-binding protein
MSKMNIRCVAAIIVLGAFALACPSTAQSLREKSDIWKRVETSGRIRCAYVTYAPYFIKDPNTGALSGIFVEAMNAIATKLDLKLDWVEEVGYTTMFEGLDSDRYDALCSGLWQNATRGKRAYFTAPLFFNAIRVWVRADETRFKTLADLNAANVRIAVQDGAIEEAIAQKEFPKAQRVAIPQMSPWPDTLLNITTKKADVTFAEIGVIIPFLDKNPGTLKELITPRPLRVFASNIPIKFGEGELRLVLDSAILEALNDGTIEGILSKYEKAPGEFLRAALPYQIPRP